MTRHQLSADLRALRVFLAEPVRWCKSESAVDDYNVPVRESGAPPSAFCLVTAIDQIIAHSGERDAGRRDACLFALQSAITSMNMPHLKGYGVKQAVISFNDHQKVTHREVMAVINRAVEQVA